MVDRFPKRDLLAERREADALFERERRRSLEFLALDMAAEHYGQADWQRFRRDDPCAFFRAKVEVVQAPPAFRIDVSQDFRSGPGGNPFFKQGNLVDGIDAIAAKANDLKVETRVVSSQSGIPIVIHEHKTAEGVWWALGGFGALVIGVVVWAIWRSRRRDAEARAARVALNEEAAELRARNIEEQDWADKVASRNSSRPATASPRAIPSPSYRPAPFVAYPSSVPPPSTTVVNNVSGNRDGGALDLMLGMELERSLERDSYRAPPVEREAVVERESSSSSSSWDSGSSDSSSSSDFGSSDSGGGDSSGGSDW